MSKYSPIKQMLINPTLVCYTYTATRSTGLRKEQPQCNVLRDTADTHVEEKT